MSAKKITEFIDQAPVETVAVQGYVPADLRSEVIAQMERDKKAGKRVTWNSLLEASLHAYLSERKAQKRG